MSKKRKGTGRTPPRPWQPLRGPTQGYNSATGKPVPGEWYGNDLYSVEAKGVQPVDADTGWPEVLHLTIHRRDRSPIIDWRHLQRIKNEIASPECEAVQLFPRESRVVDTANEFHLWVFPPGYRIPFGYESGRLVMSDVSDARGAKQRPFEADVTDTTTVEEWRERVRTEAPELARRVGLLPDAEEGFRCPECNSNHPTEEAAQACLAGHDEERAGVS